MRHRCASRNIALEATASARALMGGGLPLSSQNGFKPQVAVCAIGASSGSWTMVTISCDGAILNRGSIRFSDQSMNPKRATMSSGRTRLNLPHIQHHWVTIRAGSREGEKRMIMVDELARHWWVIALRGVAALLFGVLAFVWPGMTLAVLVLLFGAYALVDGILGILAAFRGGVQHRIVMLVEGVVSVLAGLAAFVC